VGKFVRVSHFLALAAKIDVPAFAQNAKGRSTPIYFEEKAGRAWHFRPSCHQNASCISPYNVSRPMESVMKSRQWLITLGLLVLAVAAVIGAVLTRDTGVQSLNQDSHHPVRRNQLVDERPLQTANNMAKLASTWDEQRLANQALKAGDREVDLAFEDALRDATNHPPQPTPEARELYARLNKAQTAVATDQDRVNQLTKQLASAAAAHQDEIQKQLDLMQAQLELDKDDLEDAQEDLVRSGADTLSLIQRQFKRHEDSEHASDAGHPQSPGGAQINYQAGNLFGQFVAWRALQAKAVQLQSAQAEAAEVANVLSQGHNALEQQLGTEKAAHQATAQAAEQASVIASLKRLSADQKSLSDFDRRIQDAQELQTAYANWIVLAQSHQRTAVHGMLQSALWILLIILSVYLAGISIDRYFAEGIAERTRLHTLRVVIRFALQAVGILLILLVVFGAPQQTPTILGFAGAGITVAMKDFIVAFFGWFVLMGKNGLRVGDWVEINGVAGEVIEINLLRTVLLETGNWTTTGHPTGRKVAFINSYAIEGHFFNFTTSGQWLWDEVQMMVPAEQDPYALVTAIQQTVTKETEENAKTAEKEWQNATSRYRVQSVSATPAVNLRPTPSGVEVHVRYITRAHERSAMKTKISQALVQLLRGKVVDEKEMDSVAKV
jgi:small-conductance mechanosensitive channel